MVDGAVQLVRALDHTDIVPAGQPETIAPGDGRPVHLFTAAADTGQFGPARSSVCAVVELSTASARQNPLGIRHAHVPQVGVDRHGIPCPAAIRSMERYAVSHDDAVPGAEEVDRIELSRCEIPLDPVHAEVRRLEQRSIHGDEPEMHRPARRRAIGGLKTEYQGIDDRPGLAPESGEHDRPIRANRDGIIARQLDIVHG